jgi:uncharacterized membrane protein YcaP (DUF421 family)
MAEHLFFNGWEPLFRIVIVGACSYLALIALLRGAGKRTLSKMNAYDMVITMALGSIMAKVLLSPEVSISESVLASFLLIALQYLLSFLICHMPRLHSFVSSPPAVLYHRGNYIDKTMRRERIDRREIKAAMHEKGIGDLSQVDSVILGSNGQLSVIPKTAPNSATMDSNSI